jgi:hypothetical protein
LDFAWAFFGDKNRESRRLGGLGLFFLAIRFLSLVAQRAKWDFDSDLDLDFDFDFDFDFDLDVGSYFPR